MLTNIKDFGQKIKSRLKSFFSQYKEKILISIIIIFVGSASYALGRMSAYKSGAIIPIKNGNNDTNNDNNNETQKNISSPKAQSVSTSTQKLTSKESPTILTGAIVASKNGSAYYFQNCSGASRILDKNKIYFNTSVEAETAGYHLAGNCRKIN